MKAVKQSRARIQLRKPLVDKQKQTGSYFTPDALADLLADRLLASSERNQPFTVLDPACGNGSLLAAFHRRCTSDIRARATFRGIEADAGSFAALAKRFADTSMKVDLIQGDFLTLGSDAQMFGIRTQLPSADIIIANPPYVRTQVLGSRRSQQLGEDYGLTGRVDLYHVFIVAMTRALAVGGLLGVITSNRFLTTEGGESVRRFLVDNFDLLEVIDLGDTKLFEAAVLPAIIIARRKSSGSAKSSTLPKFVRIYEQQEKREVTYAAATDVYSLLKNPESGLFIAGKRPFSVTTGQLVLSQNSVEPWRMVTAEEQAWLDIVDRNSDGTFGQVSSIRVGIKTTADSVFIRDDWEGLATDNRPEREYLRSIVSQEQSAKWKSVRPNVARRVLYTHEIRDGRRRTIDFPETSRCWQYLLANRTRLESRQYVIEAGRSWFEIWVPQDPNAWQQPKIVFPDISPGPRFFLDLEGALVDGNCYWITTNSPDDDLLFLMLGIANSRIMERYHDLRFQNRLYAGRRRYLTQYVQHYPLPVRSHPACRAIISIVRRLTAEPLQSEELDQLELLLNEHVARAFGISDKREMPG